MSEMRDLRSLSGPWTGFFVQGRVRGTMAVHLQFDDTRISGHGADRDGSFSFSGTYHPRTNLVEMTKRYPELNVHYRGTWDGQMIAGTWRFAVFIPPNTLLGDTGDFELWPQTEEPGVETLMETREEVTTG
jgi:hypothetical protein